MKPLLLAAALLLTACATTSTPTSAGKPQIGAFGVDLDGRDLTVKPGDDFAAYSGGTWMKNNQIPADRSRWGMFDQLRAQAEEDVRVIVQETAAQPQPAGSVGQKIGDFYNGYLDTAAIDALGMAPAKAGLAKIQALKTHEEVAALIATPGFPVDGPIGAYIDVDDKNPDRYIVGVTHSGLSLPEREYYLKDTKEFRDIRAKFVEHVTRLLILGGEANAQTKARQILALETQIARNHWEIAKRRERDLTYNLMSVQQLERTAPDYPWAASFAAAGLGGEKEVIVRELSAMAPLAKLFRQTPVSAWKTYLTYSYLRSSADVLPKALDDEVFDFYGRTLNGQPMQRDRWKRAVQSLDRSLGEGVGQLYVAKHFPPESKAKMAALVENLRKGYGERIKAVPWMSDETKAEALKKLATFRPKIGYPDKWRDYSKLEIKPGDAFGNKQRSAQFDWARDLARLGKPTDRDEWFMTPQTVNAYYNPTFNEIVFPAAILQPPFFDPYADDAVNYGAIGGVIGHEMGHGFDDQGAKSDAYGVLRNWWKKEDEDAFKARTDALVAQYGEFEPLPGIPINGRLTLGENIGDLGGLTVAHKAYELSLKGKPAKAKVIDGFTGDQRFFLAWGQVWRTLTRDQALRNQLLTDPHSPGLYRANGVVRNMDQWYEAFDVKPGDKLYVPPEKRVKIW